MTNTTGKKLLKIQYNPMCKENARGKLSYKAETLLEAMGNKIMTATGTMSVQKDFLCTFSFLWYNCILSPGLW